MGQLLANVFPKRRLTAEVASFWIKLSPMREKPATCAAMLAIRGSETKVAKVVERLAPAASGDAPLLLISANTTWNILNFRMELVGALQKAGYAIMVAAPAGKESQHLRNAGVTFLPFAMSSSGTSPLQDATLLVRYYRLMRKLRPTAYLGFTPKPNVYGSLAAALCGVPTINNLTGLGTAFIQGGGLEWTVSGLYRLALRRSTAVFFHNPEDRDLFVARRLVAPDRATVIPGSGVNLETFATAPMPAGGPGPTFLFVGRLLWEKGIGEFAEAARAVKQSHPHARFQILGSFADDSRAVPKALVDEWQADGSVEYLGTSSDIRPHICAADCVVLPSYREGLPRVLLEAAAMGRPAIAADAPGCRHAVVDGVTGILCKVRSGEALANAIIRMIGLSPARRETMGLAARTHAEEHFGVERVWSEYLSVMSRIGVRS